MLVHFSWGKIFDYVQLIFDFRFAFLTSSYFCGFHSKMMFSKCIFHDIMRTRWKMEVEVTSLWNDRDLLTTWPTVGENTLKHKASISQRKLSRENSSGYIILRLSSLSSCIWWLVICMRSYSELFSLWCK